MPWRALKKSVAKLLSLSLFRFRVDWTWQFKSDVRNQGKIFSLLFKTWLSMWVRQTQLYYTRLANPILGKIHQVLRSKEKKITSVLTVFDLYLSTKLNNVRVAMFQKTKKSKKYKRKLYSLPTLNWWQKFFFLRWVEWDDETFLSKVFFLL